MFSLIKVPRAAAQQQQSLEVARDFFCGLRISKNVSVNVSTFCSLKLILNVSYIYGHIDITHRTYVQLRIYSWRPGNQLGIYLWLVDILGHLSDRCYR